MSFRNDGVPNEPTRLRIALNTLMKGLSGTSLSTIEMIVEQWPNIIDESLYPFCTPATVKDKCLTITVSDAGLIQEVEWRKEIILQAIKPLFSDEVITQIKVSLHSN